MRLQQFNSKHFNFTYEVSENPKSSYFPLHSHDGYEVYLFSGGQGTYTIEGNEYNLKPETILIMRTAEMHKPNIQYGEPYARGKIHFDPEFVTAIDPEKRLLRPFTKRALGVGNLYSRSNFSSGLIYQCFESMRKLSEDEYNNHVRLTNLVYCILGEIFDAWSTRDTENRQNSLMGQITHYIERNLGAELSLCHLQNEFYISKSQLTRLFKEATGLAVWEYISLKRLTLARTYLRDGIRAGDVAVKCGFRDYSAFYRAYKKQFGTAPTDSEKKT